MSDFFVNLYDVKVTDGYWLRRVVCDRLKLHMHCAADVVEKFRLTCKEYSPDSDFDICGAYDKALSRLKKYQCSVELLFSLDLLTEQLYMRLDAYYEECEKKIYGFCFGAINDVSDACDNGDCVDSTEVEG